MYLVQKKKKDLGESFRQQIGGAPPEFRPPFPSGRDRKGWWPFGLGFSSGAQTSVANCQLVGREGQRGCDSRGSLGLESPCGPFAQLRCYNAVRKSREAVRERRVVNVSAAQTRRPMIISRKRRPNAGAARAPAKSHRGLHLPPRRLSDLAIVRIA